MLPTLPSLMSRPLMGTVRRAPSMSSPSAGVPTSYFTPNRSGPVRRPYVHVAPVPFSARFMPPSSSAHKAAQRRNTARYVLRYAAGGVGLALTFLAAPIIYCDPVTSKAAPPATARPTPPDNKTSSPASASIPPPPQSSVNFYELTFGTVCGICAGVFVKKGARVVAFALGGVFVLLQYLGSLSLVRVDWNRAATRFENLFYRTDVSGVRRPPNVGSLFRWIIDFLTADFQPRATFIAGFGLGLRVG
ncbi:FUN14 family-domain-containing protein [Fomes fomentarius]|nr:FUN14 family-domain-containing protein [Fomes fomentarius]